MAKRYKLGEIEFEVGELTIAQDQEIMRLLMECELTDLTNLSAARLMQALGAQKKLQEFFALILMPVNGGFDLSRVEEFAKLAGAMRNSAALEVAEDFFDRNRAFFKKLDAYFQKLVDLMKRRAEEIEKTLSRAQTNISASSSNSPKAT